MAMILLLLMAFRVVGSVFPQSIPNFQPLAALFFCGALVWKGWKGWAIPFAAWIVTYPAPAVFQGNESYLTAGVVISTAIAFAVTFFLGRSLSGRQMGAVLLGSIAAAVSFHLITNGAAWIFSPMYPKSTLGLWQSLWAGPVGSPVPSWVFLRNMMGANILFTAIFLSARFAIPKQSTNLEAVAAR